MYCYKDAETCYAALRKARSIILDASPCEQDGDGLVFVEGYIRNLEARLAKLDGLRAAAVALAKDGYA